MLNSALRKGRLFQRKGTACAVDLRQRGTSRTRKGLLWLGLSGRQGLCLLGCPGLLQQKTPNQLAGVSYIPRSKRSGYTAKPQRTQLMCISVFFHSWCQLDLRYPPLMVSSSAVGLGIKSRHNIQLMRGWLFLWCLYQCRHPAEGLLPVLQQTSPLGRD